jgi:hypothetical protein
MHASLHRQKHSDRPRITAKLQKDETMISTIKSKPASSGIIFALGIAGVVLVSITPVSAGAAGTMTTTVIRNPETEVRDHRSTAPVDHRAGNASGGVTVTRSQRHSRGYVPCYGNLCF